MRKKLEPENENESDFLGAVERQHLQELRRDYVVCFVGVFSVLSNILGH